ncbi:MAG: ferredoxin FdxA [Pseudomonadota bacterium]
MPYVVTDNCIRCKFTDCVDICPCDCFHEGENMLVIDPHSCIDCGICEPECPADAIKHDTDPEGATWLSLNTKYAERWPVIFSKRVPPSDADEFDGVKGKYPKLFSPRAGEGD